MTRAGASPALRAVAVDTCLQLADNLCAAGLRDRALPLYRGLLGAPGHVRCAALVGLGRAGGKAELALIFAAFDDPDAKVRGAARAALALLPAAEVITVVSVVSHSCKAETLAGRTTRNQINTSFAQTAL